VRADPIFRVDLGLDLAGEVADEFGVATQTTAASVVMMAPGIREGSGRLPALAGVDSKTVAAAIRPRTVQTIRLIRGESHSEGSAERPQLFRNTAAHFAHQLFVPATSPLSPRAIASARSWRMANATQPKPG
jgi:hypothetical protein